MSLMAPKMDTFLGHIKDAVKLDIPLEKVSIFTPHAYRSASYRQTLIETRIFFGALTDALLQEHYVLLLGAAIFLELAGAALFLANYSAGAYMLVRPRPYLALLSNIWSCLFFVLSLDTRDAALSLLQEVVYCCEILMRHCRMLVHCSSCYS